MANARTTTTTTTTTSPAKGAKASKGASKAPKGAKAKVADASTAPPAGGYVLVKAACPARDGTSRAKRWPLLVAHAGKPGGIKALHTALKDGNWPFSARGMLGWAQGAGAVVADGIKAKASKAKAKASN